MVKPWQVILATIGIFVAGLVTGGAVAFRIVKGMKQSQQAQATSQTGVRPMLSPDQLGPQLIHRFAMAKELSLMPAQRMKINQIARGTAEKLSRLRRETALNSLLLIEQMQDEISNELTPQQREKFENLLSGQREKMLKFKTMQENQLRKVPSDADVSK